MKMTKGWMVKVKEGQSQPEDYFDFVECFGIAFLSLGYGGATREVVEGAASPIVFASAGKRNRDSQTCVYRKPYLS